MITSAQDKLPLPVELPSMTPDRDSTPVQVDGLTSARPCGEPLFKLPQDLYILPGTLEVFLEASGGPLNLLLHLICRQNFNVLDTPLAQIAWQYLACIEQIHAANLGLAAEYLLMAAILIEAKSHILLPVKRTDSDDEPEDLRAELVHRLLEYKQMKLTAQKLDTMPQLSRDPLRTQIYIKQSLALRYPDVSSDDLRVAWTDVLRRAKLMQHHRVSHEELSVYEHMGQILRRLRYARFMEFTELFEEATQFGRGIPIMIVNFAAMLELSHKSLPKITQTEPYASIYVRLAYSPT